MNNEQKFKNFLESLKGNGQDSLIESVKKGFQVCHEGIKGETYAGAVERLGEPFSHKSPPEGPTISAGEALIKTDINDELNDIDVLVQYSTDALIDNVIIADTEENRKIIDILAEEGIAIGDDIYDKHYDDKWFEQVRRKLDEKIFN